MSATRRSFMRAAACAACALATVPPAHAQSAPSLTIRRLAWAGVRFDAGNTIVYVDAVAPLPAEGGLDLGAESSNARRYALITHGHGDHFDIDYLHRLLGENGVIFCHRQIVGDIDQRALRVQAVEHWEPVFLPRSGADMIAFAVPAVDGFGSFQTSWVLRCGATRVLEPGEAFAL